MRNCNIFVSSMLALLLTHTEAEARTMKNPWFSNTDCSLLEIQKFKSISDHRITNSIKIEDADAIKSLMQRIAKIPADGNMMKSFSDEAEEINLVFHCADKIQKIGIFNKRFQTPSTGFNVGTNPLEENLYHDIDALLFRDFHKRMLKIKDLSLPFKDFTVIYKGTTFQDFYPESIQFATQQYLFRDKINEQLIKIQSGQVAPQPKLVNLQLVKILPYRSTVKVYTYKSSQGEDLYPAYFQIVK